MNARVAALVAPERSLALAGDQLYVDMDLSERKLPPNATAIGSAVIEVTPHPHGCKKSFHVSASMQ